MRDVSPAFRVAVSGDHERVVVVRATWTDRAPRDLAVVAGAVTVDRSAAQRRRASLDLVDPTAALLGYAAEDLLAATISIESGVRFADGTTETVPVFTGYPTDWSWSDQADSLTLRLELSDLSGRVARARFPEPYAVAPGTSIVGAIRDIVDARVSTTWTIGATDRLTPQAPIVFDTRSDPWDAARQLATSLAADLYFDAAGAAVLTPAVDATVPVWSFVEGERSNLVSVQRNLTTAGSCSRIVVTGEGSGVTAPVRATAVDTDPASPTYVETFGDVAAFITSPLIQTTADAQTLADRTLARSRGIVEQISLTSVPMPALDAGDVVTVERDRAGVVVSRTIETLTLPLGPEPMSVQLTQRGGAEDS